MFLKKYTIFSLIAVLFTLPSCQDRKKDNTNSQALSYDSLEASITIMKSYVRKLDSALLQTTTLETLLMESDSAKSALRSRDRDRVRMYEIEKTPLLDTLSDDYGDRMLEDANKVLEEAKYTIETTREQIDKKKNQYTQGEIDPEREITQKFQAHMKESERIIAESENAAENLQKEIDRRIKAQ